MKNSIKYPLYCLLTGVVAWGFASCELDEKLVSTYGVDNAYVTEQNAQEGVNGIYAYLLAGTHPSTFYLNDMSADDCFKAGMDYELMNDNAMAGNVDVARCYNGNWQMIGTANADIDNIALMDDAAFSTPDKKTELLAESHFMRGFAYYQLSNVFYRIPLVTDSHREATAESTLSTVEDVDQQIVADLQIAARGLPLSWSVDEAARPTVGAAYGYLMRLYMREAGRLREAGQDATASWTTALNYADSVINTGMYALQPTIWDVFDPTSEASLNNNELIFAVRASETVPAGASDLALYFTHWDYNYGWDIFNIPLSFYWKFDPADERYSKLMVGEFSDVYADADGTHKLYKAPEDIMQVGTINDESSSPIVIELAQAYTDKYYYANAGTYNYNTPNNLPLLRYADVLLSKAEILNELNGVNQQSIDLINQIRARAFRDDTHDYAVGDFASKEDLRNAICDERMFELNNEGVRRIDLIRMGLWKERMDKYMDAIQAVTKQKEINMGVPAGTLDAEWSAYPKFSSNPLKTYDKRRYYPIPKVYSDKYPDLLNNRDFPEE